MESCTAPPEKTNCKQIVEQKMTLLNIFLPFFKLKYHRVDQNGKKSEIKAGSALLREALEILGGKTVATATTTAPATQTGK